MDEQIKQNIRSGRIWLRALYMVFFLCILYIASLVFIIGVVSQFLFVLITSEQNEKLAQFMDSLTQFLYQTIKFLSFNSDVKPFPFDDWPESDVIIVPSRSEPTEEIPVAAEAENADESVTVESERSMEEAEAAESEDIQTVAEAQEVSDNEREGEPKSRTESKTAEELS